MSGSPGPLTVSVLVDEPSEPVGDGLGSRVLGTDCLRTVVDVDGHVRGLQAGCVPGVGEVDGCGDVFQATGAVAAGAEVLVGAELVLVFCAGGDLVGDDDRLLACAVPGGVVVDLFEEVPEHHGVWLLRVPVAGVEASDVDAFEEVADASVLSSP